MDTKKQKGCKVLKVVVDGKIVALEEGTEAYNIYLWHCRNIPVNDA